MSDEIKNPTWTFDFKFNNPDTWLPTFGSWCGKGWSAGERNPSPVLTLRQRLVSATVVNGRQSPVDSWCKRHDLDVSDAHGSPRTRLETLKADLNLYQKTSPFNLIGLTTGESAYANQMRSAFAAKILLWDIPGAVYESVAAIAKSAYKSVFGVARNRDAAAFRAPASAEIAPIPAVAVSRPFGRYPSAVRPWGRNQPVAPLGLGRWGIEPGRGQSAIAPTSVAMRSQRHSGVPMAAASPSIARAWQPMRYQPGQLGSGLWNMPQHRLPAMQQFRTSSPPWVTGRGSMGSMGSSLSLSGSTHSLVQAMASFRPPLAAQTRWAGARCSGGSSFNARPFWLSRAMRHSHA